MWKELLALLLAACLLAGAQGFCDICHLRNNHTKDFATPFEAPVEEFKYCQQWKDNACCTKETANNVIELYGEANRFDRCDFDPNTPKNMSDGCRDFFIAQDCFYECDVSAGKYRRHINCGSVDGGNSWEIKGMPIKASFCDSWFEACKDDYICATPEIPSLMTISDHSCEYEVDADGNEIGDCRKFSDVFMDGKDICELMWGESYIYETREDQAYTMNFSGSNPNTEINLHIAFPDPCPEHDVATAEEGCGDGSKLHPNIIPHDCEVCKLRNAGEDGNVFTLNISLPADGSLGKCSKYESNACCAPATAERIDQELYGPEFAWDRCYKKGGQGTFPEKCNRWFIEEYCFYECDVNAGKYRLFDDCTESDEGPWRIFGAPIRASECDQWYEDCKDTLFCACLTEADCKYGGVPRSFFSLPNLTCTSETCKTFGEIYANGKELCEVMWDQAFVYERHEKAAYSFAWDLAQTNENPNNFVNTHIEFPPNCDGHEAEKEWCGSGQQIGAENTANEG